MTSLWLLLIYTVPAEPSRKRAAIWRDIKKAGAVYLRDGVCVLPERHDARAAFRAIAARVAELGGQATVAQAVRLDPVRASAVAAEARTARAAEYAEVARGAERFLAHVRQEREHRELTYPELEEMEADLGKLKRWADQVRARDHFEAPGTGHLGELLARCEDELRSFLHEASTTDSSPPAAAQNDTRPEAAR